MTLFDSPPVAPHPARFTAAHIEVLIEACAGFERILDPFAGTGGIHRLAAYHDHVTIGVEIQPQWAAQHPDTLVGDARHLPFPARAFDAVATSPTYGNRMADHHDARDASIRHTYRHYLGRQPSSASSAVLQWGPAYRRFHEAAWAEATRVVRPGGRIVLNVKDHVRAGRVVPVTAWHAGCLGRLGWRPLRWWNLAGAGLAHGENHDRRVPVEHIIAFERQGR